MRNHSGLPNLKPVLVGKYLCTLIPSKAGGNENRVTVPFSATVGFYCIPSLVDTPAYTYGCSRQKLALWKLGVSSYII